MALIRNEQASAAFEAVRFSLRDIEADAQAKLARATREAEAIIEQAKARAHEIAAEARACGFADGQTRGFENGLARGAEQGRHDAILTHSDQLKSAIAALEHAARNLVAARVDLEASVMSDAIALSLAIARRVTRREAAIDPQVLLGNLREAMNLVARNSPVRIALHPAQRALLLDSLTQLQQEYTTLRDAELLDDDSIAPGGCRVFTPHGRIDADLDAQLDRIARELLPAQETRG